MGRSLMLAAAGVSAIAIGVGAAGAQESGKASTDSNWSAAMPAWQGYYAGLFASDDLTAIHLAVPGASFDGLGGETTSFGGLIGFNKRPAERVVIGGEINAAVANGASHYDFNDSGDYFNISIKPEWGAALKGRIGFLASPQTLFYLAGGGVIAVANYGCSSSVTTCDGRMHQTLYGWPLLGLGAETEIGPNWRLRYEYDLKFLPTLDFDPITATPLSGSANFALIRDFGTGSHAPADAAPFGYAPKTWTGLYAGLAGGYAMSSTKFQWDEGGFAGTFDSLGGGGATGGVFGGYNQQLGNFVVGAEAGQYWNAGHLGASIDGEGAFRITGNSYYSFRGRAGLIVNPSTMVYALAGWLHADGKVTVYDGSGTPQGSESFSREGKEIGGGIETWLNPRFSVRAEYAYAMFSGGLAGIPSDTLTVDSHVGTATVGAVLHFGK